MREWLDLDTELTSFYRLAAGDPLLGPLTEKYRGLRLIKIPDFFESLVWAIIGQQINLAFAYTLKRRLVERYGEKLVWQDRAYWLFPAPAAIAALVPAELTALGLTGRKAEYIIGAARVVAEGRLSKAVLLGRDIAELRVALLALRGVGEWTADYVIMKSLHNPAALPAADAGLRQALCRLGWTAPVSADDIKALAANWKGWEAYAAFYLWRSLYD